MHRETNGDNEGRYSATAPTAPGRRLVPLAPHPSSIGLQLHVCAAVIVTAACWHSAHALTLSQHLSWPSAPTRTSPATAEVMASIGVPSTPPTAASSQAATTWAALLGGLDQAPGVKEAKARAEASQAISEQSQARAWLPRVDASVRTDEQRQRYNGLATRTPSSASTLQATLPLWRPADRANARADDAVAEQAQWQASLRRQSLARELSQSYLSAVEAAEQTRLTRAYLAALEQQARAHQKRLQAGLGTVLDALETRARQEQALAQSEQLLSRLCSLTLTLNRLSGMPAAPPDGLNPHSPEDPDVTLPPLQDATAQALSSHPEVLDARAGVRGSLETIRARDAERWQPTLDATAGHSRTRQTQRFEGQSDRQDIRTEAVGLVLNWPLFSSGFQQARQREAAALLSAAQARLDDAEARVATELQDAYQRHEQARRQQARQEAVVASTQATLDAVQKAWLAGLRGTTELLDAQQRLHNARMAHASARVATLQAGSDALALLGLLDATHIAPWLGLFDAASTSFAPSSP
ncbi:outer membrane protein TolC [Aquabacterium commune]|uniref:Outer membrane protein TolC n=1 Tax=Aquabacterium commune TaxID=70586 RepID=A0A4R6R6U2_9BURK|nr:outer membrane protein TolC [Aquabacterium commune]